MAKKQPIKRCSWCNTKLQALRSGCPRGPQCGKDQSNHESLMARIKALAVKK